MIRLAIQSKGRLNEESDGPACHRGTESCFDIAPEQGFLGKLEKVVRKASDLLYHLLVLNEQMGIGLEDLEKELLSRHK